MATLSVLLSGGGVENGALFQFALYTLGVLCALYIIGYVVFKRHRAKEILRLHEEALRLEQDAENILPSH